MMKLSVCIEMFFTDVPFPERIAKVAEAGYRAAEFWGHEGKDLQGIAAACAAHGVEIACIVGTGIDPGLDNPDVHDKLARDVEKAIEAAKVVGCEQLIVMSGNVLAKVTRSAQDAAIIEGLRKLAALAEDAGMTLVLENLNTTHDHAGYFLDSLDALFTLLRAADRPNVKALCDIYHAGIMEGNLIEKITGNIDLVGHFHVAGIPGRHELAAGEQNYPAIVEAIYEAGYDGHVGMEYEPVLDSHASLVESREWLEG